MDFVEQVEELKKNYGSMTGIEILDLADISRGTINGIASYKNRLFICDFNNYILEFGTSGEYIGKLCENELDSGVEVSSFGIDSTRDLLWFTDNYHKELYIYNLNDCSLKKMEIDGVVKGDPLSLGPVALDHSGNCYTMVQGANTLSVNVTNRKGEQVIKHELPFLSGITSLIIGTDNSCIMLAHQEGSVYSWSSGNCELDKLYSGDNIKLHFLSKKNDGFIGTVHSNFLYKMVDFSENFEIDYCYKNTKIKDPACICYDSGSYFIINRFDRSLWYLTKGNNE